MDKNIFYLVARRNNSISNKNLAGFIILVVFPPAMGMMSLGFEIDFEIPVLISLMISLITGLIGSYLWEGLLSQLKYRIIIGLSYSVGCFWFTYFYLYYRKTFLNIELIIPLILSSIVPLFLFKFLKEKDEHTK